MNIDALEAGRELDSLVATKITGWTVEGEKLYRSPDGFVIGLHDLPRYSTHIAAAWQVVEKLRSQGYELSLISDSHDERGTYAAEFDNRSNKWMDGQWADTAPLAICKAALAALEDR